MNYSKNPIFNFKLLKTSKKSHFQKSILFIRDREKKFRFFSEKF